LGVVLLGGSTAVSYYVDALWFESLGFASVFWTRLSLQAAAFGAFALVTFLVVYGVFRALKPNSLGQLVGATILVNQRPVTLPVEPVLKLIGLGLSLGIAAVTGASMMERWMTLALFWDAPRNAALLDPIFGQSLDFYLFTLPALQLISGWLLTLSVFACLIAAAFVVVTGGARILPEWRSSAAQTRLWRGLSISLAAFFLMLAVRAYLGRFERLFQDGTVFSGVTYTDAHVTLSGTLVVCVALIVGAVIAGIAAAFAPRPRWLLATAVPAIACYLIVAGVRWWHLGVLAAATVLTALAVLWFLPSAGINVLKPYQAERLTGWTHPNNDPRGATYNLRQSMTAVGAGGLRGRGVIGATQTRLNYLPEHATDFAFASLAEERGFFGASILLLLYLLIVWRALKIVTRARDFYSAIVAGGIAFMFMFQVFVNVAMTMGSAPITGIPLPFVSVGGSSMITNFLAIGILESIHLRRPSRRRS